MNSVLEEIVTTGLTRTPGGEKVEVKPESISPKEGRYLQQIIADLNPAATLEIGMAYGVSSLYICDALKIRDNTRHIIIDPQDSKMPWFRVVVFDDEDGQSIRKRCRYIAANQSYSVFEPMYPFHNDKKSKKRSLVNKL